MRLFDDNARVTSEPGETHNGRNAVVRERPVAQSRLREPIANVAGLGAAKSNIRNVNHAFTAALTIIATDIALLSLAVLSGYMLDSSLFSSGSAVAESHVALWIPALFITTSAALLFLFDAQQAPSHGISTRDWVQTSGIISFTGVVAWAVCELMASVSVGIETAASIWVASIILIPLGRGVVRQTLNARGIGCKRIIVVGDMERASAVIKQLSKNGSPYQLAGFVSAESSATQSTSAPAEPGSAGEAAPVYTLDSLPGVIETEKATDVLIAVANDEYSSVREKVRETLPENVTLHVALNPLLNEPSSGQPEMVEGMPALRFRGRSMPWSYETVKRAFDFSTALTLLLLASPLLIAVAVIVKLDSNGPVFFKQQRVGRRGERFGMYKFRSMRVNAEAMLQDLMKHNEASGAMFKMKDDPRITRVGKIIRKLSIDELPQLFNVLNGTMSLVGPRPPLPREVQGYEERHFERLDGVPGITGLWQIKRGPVLDFEEMVEFDLEYLRNWSLKKDVVILIKTVPVVITGRGAY